ncbi:Uma2 family endonuclease [Streptacidiphilus rugosus]|uniref:Uma2 family endonuclease n=1 Tax=Streptacidiphilus rugosus TaxID=405783 RepID=UPI00055ABD41|nr:Uma2 family endonuclease [Streptacidiphilus rugosus]
MSDQSDMDRAWEELEVPDGLTAEYFGGQIIMQANPTTLHDFIIRNVTRQDFPGVEAWGERGMDLETDGKPRPDVVFIAPEDIPMQVRDWPVSLVQAVAEVVSPSSAKDDLRTKRELYALHRIPVYLVVDPRQATWHVLTLSGIGYVETAEGVFGQSIPLELPAGQVTVTTQGWQPYPL